MIIISITLNLFHHVNILLSIIFKTRWEVSKLYVWNGDSTHFNKLVSLYVQILTKPKQKSYIQKFYNLKWCITFFLYCKQTLYILTWSFWRTVFPPLWSWRLSFWMVPFWRFSSWGPCSLRLSRSCDSRPYSLAGWPRCPPLSLFCLRFNDREDKHSIMIYMYNFIGIGKRMGKI